MDSSQPNRPPLETPEHSSAPSSRTQGLKDAATGPEGAAGPEGRSVPPEAQFLRPEGPTAAQSGPSFYLVAVAAGVSAVLAVLLIVLLGSLGLGPGAFFFLLWAGIALLFFVLLSFLTT